MSASDAKIVDQLQADIDLAGHELARIGVEKEKLRKKFRWTALTRGMATVQLVIRSQLNVYDFKPVVLITVPFALGMFSGAIFWRIFASIGIGVGIGLLQLLLWTAVAIYMLYWPSDPTLKASREVHAEEGQKIQDQIKQIDQEIEAQKDRIEALLQQITLANQQGNLPPSQPSSTFAPQAFPVSEREDRAGTKFDTRPVEIADDAAITGRDLAGLRSGQAIENALVDVPPEGVATGEVDFGAKGDLQSVDTRPAVPAWRNLTGGPFESCVVSIFRGLGYRVQRIEPNRRQGVDLVVYHSAQRVAIKVQGGQLQLTNSAIQQVYAGMTLYDCQSCAVITNGSFSESARQIARSTKCVLISELQMQRLVAGKIFPRLANDAS